MKSTESSCPAGPEVLALRRCTRGPSTSPDTHQSGGYFVFLVPRGFTFWELQDIKEQSKAGGSDWMWLPVCGKIIRCLIGILSCIKDSLLQQDRGGFPAGCLKGKGAPGGGTKHWVGGNFRGWGFGAQVGQPISYLFIYSSFIHSTSIEHPPCGKHWS